MSIRNHLNNTKLIKDSPSLLDRFGHRNGSKHHNKVVRQLRHFVRNLERDMHPEPWTNLSGPMVLVLADVCDALELSDDERAAVLGTIGEQALADALESRPVLTPLNERQAKALAHAQQTGSISLRAYRELCPGWSDETLRLDLVELAELGLLVKNGKCKGTYYSVAVVPLAHSETQQQCGICVQAATSSKMGV